MKQREPDDKGRDGEVSRVAGPRASMAQLLLLVRLRARNRRDLAVDSLERAAHVIYVTCKNWFFPARKQADKPATQASDARPVLPGAGPDNNNKDTGTRKQD